MKIIIALAYPVFVLFSIPEVNGKDEDFNIDVKQKNAEVYHEQSSKNNEFNYGYQVEKENSQFQHKVKGPDDVTYGCYGYIDPNNEKHLVYYVADRLGYRLVPPNQPTKIFTERVASSINKLNKDLKDKKLDEKVVAWNDLYLPDSCRRLDEILTITTAAPQAGHGNGNAGKDIKIYVNTNSKTTTRAPLVITTPVSSNFKSTRASLHVDTTTEFPYKKPSTTRKPFVSNENSKTDESLSDQLDKLYNAAFPNNTSSPYAGDTFDPVYVAPISQPTISTIDPETTGYTYPVPKNPLQDCQLQSNPLIGQYNGYVYPLNSECSSTEYNVRQLMIQMESLNQQVLELTANLRALQQDNSSSPDCHQWLSRQQFPLLIYVPILLPYLGNGFDSASHQQSLKNPASYSFQKMCEECISK
ncbi:AAEL008193-PA [Aedes aegypti]|uniref:AAEL008193-PA n=1 Tax=Aedes aegypti TaxID=7159 RepID=Q16ZH8_AEDAE|nr:AAEL008193-PA [Aedes aegypti]